MHASRTLPLHYLNDETSTDTSTVDNPSIPSTTATESLSSLSSSLLSSSLLRSWFPNDRQVLEFREPNTNVTVLLIGSMHYNPASIKLVERTLTRLGDDQKLGSVIIESCDIRWNKTQEILRRKKEEEEEERTQNPLWFLGLRRDDENNSDDEDEDEIETSPPPPPPPPFETNNDQDFLGNEMRAAWEVATRYNRPTVLGDQRINVTVDALKASLKETASDLLWGGPGGWKRSRDEIAENWDKTIPIAALGGSNNNRSNNNNNNNKPTMDPEDTESTAATSEPAYLNAVAFFDPRLLLSLPVSLVKYPLSFLVKDPVPVGAFFLCIAALNFYGTGMTIIDPTTTLDWTDPKALWEAVVAGLAQQYNNNNNNNNGGNHDDYYYYYDSYSVLPWTDYVLSVAIAVVETIVFARLLLKPLLADRNEILARSVLDQCRLFAAAAEPGIGEQRRTKSGRSLLSSSSWFDRWFAGPQAAVAAIATGSTVDGNGDGDGEPGIVYVPGSEPETLLARDSSNNNNNNNKSDGEKVVVAVLGMAHCNGVMKLLREQKV
eukprot:CAMPEP_0172378432 /NCGR_PEP_ID=MMETSP1060-20121228/69405_1 /TAXON_ID=37318 /ORGANISM="Pseudo-nitzschia pungens, Strain cf. cingulata" /LENGTH=547 /DNA_ID=CAMNT_0013106149 /DNA_START=1039 /DNA_END=2682 /DNA_ORIENTATION=-